MKLVEASIDELQAAMAAGRTTSRALVEGYLARIDAYDSEVARSGGSGLNAVTQRASRALVEAEAADRERAQKGARGSLHGIPVLVKDNMDVAGMATTGGSKPLVGCIASTDAFVVRRLREAGAVILGKTNLHELAAGITTVGSAGGRTRNPYDRDRNPGGSSGGSGAAIAASFAAIGTASDTCGSIRIPAAQNCLVGLRPTQGLTSLSGIMPLCARQDVVGPLARSVRDLAIGLDAMVGVDDADPATEVARGRIPSFVSALDDASLEGRRIGRLDCLFEESGDEGGDDHGNDVVASVVREALSELESRGAEIVPVSLPELRPLLDTGFTVILGDVASDFEMFMSQRDAAPVSTLVELLATGEVHPEVAPVLQAAVDHSFRDTDAYRDAIANRTKIRDLLEGTMRASNLDALAYPPILRVAAPLGELQLGSNAYAAADSGLPAISLPSGFDADGHPIGLELLGPSFHDAELVALASAIEASRPVRRPPEDMPEL